MKKEKIDNKALKHSSLGTFTLANKNKKPKLLSGGQGQEKI